jgi:hypothetical protein
VTDTRSRSAPSIAMLGATGSGKSTFLGALQIAFTRQARDWRLWWRDEASREALVGMNRALISEGKFPLPTTGIDTFDWILRREVERTERTGWLRTQTVSKSVEVTLKLADPSGEITGSDQIGLAPREQLVEHLARSQGILYMFDPIREFKDGDAYDKTYSLLMDMIAAVASDPGFDGRLPHQLAVCVTKLDEPRVFKTAEELGMLMWDEDHPLGFPQVHDTHARDLLDRLCEISRNGTADVVPQLFEQYFHPSRIRYYVTSAVGFMVNKRTRRFDIRDTENVYRMESGRSLVRGPVHPINVVEPVRWLVDASAAAPTPTPSGRGPLP